MFAVMIWQVICIQLHWLCFLVGFLELLVLPCRTLRYKPALTPLCSNTNVNTDTQSGRESERVRECIIILTVEVFVFISMVTVKQRSAVVRFLRGKYLKPYNSQPLGVWYFV